MYVAKSEDGKVWRRREAAKLYGKPVLQQVKRFWRHESEDVFIRELQSVWVVWLVFLKDILYFVV